MAIRQVRRGERKARLNSHNIQMRANLLPKEQHTPAPAISVNPCLGSCGTPIPLLSPA